MEIFIDEENILEIIKILVSSFDISTPPEIICEKFKSDFGINFKINKFYSIYSDELNSWFHEEEINEALTGLFKKDLLQITVDDNGEFLFSAK